MSASAPQASSERERVTPVTALSARDIYRLLERLESVERTLERANRRLTWLEKAFSLKAIAATFLWLLAAQLWFVAKDFIK